MPRFYCLGRWLSEAREAGNGSTAIFLSPPKRTVGLIDLGHGFGFFSTDSPLDDPAGYITYGDGETTLESVAVSPTDCDAWAAALGMATTPTSATLLDLLWDTLTTHSDPTGAAGPKPIIPTWEKALELHLGGHSLVRSVKMPADPTHCPHWDKIQAVLHDNYRAVEAACKDAATQKQRDLKRRWLGAQAEKYGLSDVNATALLVPDDLEKVSPLKPETTITESFDKADADTLGPDLSWGGGYDTGASGWNVVSNRAQTVTWGDIAYALSDLSSDDHYAQVAVHADGGDSIGAMARCPSTSVHTGYLGFSDHNGGDYLMRKVVADSYTTLGFSFDGYSAPHGEVVRIHCDGSSISLYVDDVLTVGPITDTEITGNVRCGIWAWNSGAILDDFEAGDLVPPPANLTPKGWFG